DLEPFSPVATGFERARAAFVQTTHERWRAFRRVGHDAAKVRDLLVSQRMSQALVTCAGMAYAWGLKHPTRRRRVWLNVVGLLAFHGWNERVLVGEHALAVDVADLATRGVISPRLSREAHRLPQLCRDRAKGRTTGQKRPRGRSDPLALRTKRQMAKRAGH